MSKNELKGRCPICKYLFEDCQCFYCGNAHPDRSERQRVVFDHLYLFDRAQIRHIRKLQHHFHISYGDEAKNEIYKEILKEIGAADGPILLE